MSRRRQVREVCVQVLYQLDLNPDVAWSYIDQYVRERLKGATRSIETAIERIRGVQRYQHDIDRRIATIATHWKLDRIAPTDRAILRLACYEMLYEGTPGPVVINEAIELAKRFGDEQSPRFVNGILDRVYKPDQSSHSPADALDPTAATDSAVNIDSDTDTERAPRRSPLAARLRRSESSPPDADSPTSPAHKPLAFDAGQQGQSKAATSPPDGAPNTAASDDAEDPPAL